MLVYVFSKSFKRGFRFYASVTIGKYYISFMTSSGPKRMFILRDASVLSFIAIRKSIIVKVMDSWIDANRDDLSLCNVEVHNESETDSSEQ